MRRRTLLKAGAGALPLTSLASVTSAGTGPQDEPYEPLDSVEITGAREAAVGDGGDVAYVAVDDGFAVVDISDPESLEVLAERRGIDLGGTSTLTTVFDLWPWEDRLAVSGPAQANPASAQGFALFDVSDPASPEKVAVEETGYYIHNSYFEDGVVYLTGNGLVQAERRVPLVMYDVTDDEPEEVGRWSPVDHDDAWGEVSILMRILHDVSVRDGIAYLPYWDGGTWIVDVSDPANPEALDRVGDYTREELAGLSRSELETEYLTPDGNDHFAGVNEEGTLLAVGKEAWSRESGGEVVGGAGGIYLYDVTDKQNAEKVAEIEPPEAYAQGRGSYFTTSHNCEIVGDRLYTSWYFGGVKLHDVSDPENPEELAWWRDPLEASFWTAQAGDPGEFFVASSADPPIPPGNRQPVGEGLYTFPDRAGEQPDAPVLTQSPAELLGTDPTPTATPDDSPTPTEAPTPTEDPTPTDAGSDSADDDSAGFGVGGALTAIGGAGYLLLRRLGGDE